ncbi:D,D-heptose 1,7-bisphosphate phosphatase [[Eubacterium] yurii subsp. margaretiae ATCC 43715]|nr:D,D-heptose 1,7-bisphosphate phosphatase [[Eubacterium] yurii subsp. margaretiae ATCC 43715]
MKIVIMAGGKGIRISSIRDDIPKPMIDINGKPVLQHQIEFFKKNGYNDFIIVIGHLGNKIIDYFGNGSKYNVNIKYFFEDTPLGTAGALKKIKSDLADDFLLVNGDIIFDIDLDRLIEFHKKKNALATIVTHPNSHPYDSSLIFIDNDSCVVKWLVKEDDRNNIYGNRVNAGIHLLSSNIINFIDKIDKEKIDLDRDVLKKIVKIRGLYSYDTPEYIHDMGTPDRYTRVCEDLKRELPKKKNLKNRQKAIFLDRDGTINEYKGFINKADDIELLDGVSDAIKKINSSEYLAIVITNQPVIARGECTVEELNNIHEKLKYLLGLDGAYLDDIFYCPHHPDIGFDGEVKELKIKCTCRKPDNGLLLEASEKYNIDLESSYMIGDSIVDIQAGEKSLTGNILLTDSVNEYSESKYRFKISKNLKESINYILS